MKLLILLFCSFSIIGHSQECWQCLSHLQQENDPEAITPCEWVMQHGNSVAERSVAAFSLARKLMDQQQFAEALVKLKTADSLKETTFHSLVEGLKGDCYAELGKLEKAIDAYSLAANEQIHDVITPYFLHKAGSLCSDLGKNKEAFLYFKHIENEFQQYYNKYAITRYIDRSFETVSSNQTTDKSFAPFKEKIIVGSINGREISMSEYSRRLNRVMKQDREMLSYQSREYTHEDLQQSEDRAWQEYVMMELIRTEALQLKLEVTEREFTAYLFGDDGFQLLPDIKVAFSDNIGNFNREMFQLFLSQKESDRDPYMREQWLTTIALMKEQLLQQKYFSVLEQGFYVTSPEAKRHYHEAEDQLVVELALKPFRDIPDSTIELTNAEIYSYYEAHKNEAKYRSEANRDLVSIVMPVLPVKDDSLLFEQQLITLKESFKTAYNDTLFVDEHSDNKNLPVYRIGFRPDSDTGRFNIFTYPVAVHQQFDKAQVGDVIGPYQQNGKYYVAKVLGFNNALLKVRHILIASSVHDSPTQRAAQKKVAEELLKKTNSSNFEKHVRDYSADGGSKEKGVYSDFLATDVVPTFGNYAATAPIGKIGLVETDFGYHLVEVLERKSVHYPILAAVEKTFVSTSKNTDDTYSSAEKLLTFLRSKLDTLTDEITKMEQFRAVADSLGLEVHIWRTFESAPKISGTASLNAENELMSLLYNRNAHVGQLGQYPIIDDDRILIPMISCIHDGSGLSYAALKTIMQPELLKEKKAEQIRQQLKNETQLSQIALQLNVNTTTLSITLGNASLKGLGYEPQLIGELFRAKNASGKLLYIKGNTGFFAIQPVKFESATAKADYSKSKLELQQQLYGNLMSELMQAMQKNAHVIDRRRSTGLGN